LCVGKKLIPCLPVLGLLMVAPEPVPTDGDQEAKSGGDIYCPKFAAKLLAPFCGELEGSFGKVEREKSRRMGSELLPRLI
jgi:hypothetical protein